MNFESINLKDWLSPFTNFNDLLLSLMILSKFRTSILNYTRKLQIVFGKSISEISLSYFVSRVKTYPDLYGCDFWKHQTTIQEDISKMFINSGQNICEFLTELDFCYFCDKTLGRDSDILYNCRV